MKAEPDREREGRITPVKSGVWFLRWMVRRNRKRSAKRPRAVRGTLVGRSEGEKTGHSRCFGSEHWAVTRHSQVERNGLSQPPRAQQAGTGFLLKNSAVFFSPGFEVSSGKDLIIPDDTDNGTAGPSHRSHYVRSSGRGQTSGENKPMINALSSPSLPTSSEVDSTASTSHHR